MFIIEGLLETSGPAADTGSATHKAVETWHQNGQDHAAAIGKMHADTARYPLADLPEAAALFLRYSADPRNIKAKFAQHNGKTVIETKIAIELAPAPNDPTKEKIVIIGTLDQLRLDEYGRKKLYDLKTSKRPGNVLLREHQYQIAAYVKGAAKLLGERVDPGSLICPRQYNDSTRLAQSAPPGVFFPFAWTFDDVDRILDGLRYVVAAIRSGVSWFNPGEYCDYCHFKSPDFCMPQHKRSLPLA